MKIREVGPRDGLQDEPEVLPTADQIRLQMVAAAGLKLLLTAGTNAWNQ